MMYTGGITFEHPSVSWAAPGLFVVSFPPMVARETLAAHHPRLPCVCIFRHPNDTSTLLCLAPADSSTFHARRALSVGEPVP